MAQPQPAGAQAISAGELDTPIHVPAWSWMLVAFAVFVTYLITLENGAVLGHLAENAHELFHDARHFVGIPCH